jgi:hypothetical protein
VILNRHRDVSLQFLIDGWRGRLSRRGGQVSPASLPAESVPEHSQKMAQLTNTELICSYRIGRWPIIIEEMSRACDVFDRSNVIQNGPCDAIVSRAADSASMRD